MQITDILKDLSKARTWFAIASVLLTALVAYQIYYYALGIISMGSSIYISTYWIGL